MGWSFTSGATKKSVIAELTKGWDNVHSKATCLAHCVKGNILWAVMETEAKLTAETSPDPEHLTPGTKEKWILCSILGAEKDFGWGSKDMDEGMGPCYYTCPISYLETVTVITNAAWRAKVHEYHAKRSIKLKIGDKIKLTAGCKPDVLTVCSVKPLRARVEGGEQDGRAYSVPRRYIEGVIS